MNKLVDQKCKRRKEYRTLGLCRDCGSPLMVGSKSFCEKHYLLYKDYRKRRSSAGKCLRCGSITDSFSTRCAKCSELHASKSRKSKQKHRRETIEKYGNVCNCCGEDTYEFLTFDHIDGSGSAHRKEVSASMMVNWIRANNYPNTIQLLCWNCNAAKSKYGTCPHNIEKQNETLNNK